MLDECLHGGDGRGVREARTDERHPAAVQLRAPELALYDRIYGLLDPRVPRPDHGWRNEPASPRPEARDMHSYPRTR